MSAFVILSQRVGTNERRVGLDQIFASESEAKAVAVRMNCKPFTPFYFWVEQAA